MCSTLVLGPEPVQIGTTTDKLVALGVTDPQEGPVLDVLIRAVQQ